MGDNRNECCDRDRVECCEKECNRNCRERYCPEPCCEDNNILGILIFLGVLYFLFCNNNNGRGGLFGGLF
ncbi:MAG: hypothetical protein RR313_01835 [Anaerovoracaceae bacterium]